jgi:hypothetical protein
VSQSQVARLAIDRAAASGNDVDAKTAPTGVRAA